MSKRKGNYQELKTIAYLSKINWIAVRSAGSMGVADVDVLAYNMKTGEIKHIQVKSNGHYAKSDISNLKVIRSLIEAPNVSVELWDWYDYERIPKVTIITANGS